MLASGVHSLTWLGIACGVLVLLVATVAMIRIRTLANGFLLLMAMSFVGATLFLFAPARPTAHRARLVQPTPPVPQTPESGLPLASIEGDRIDLEHYFETVKEQGEAATEFARIKLRVGAEAAQEVARQVAEQTRGLVQQHPIPPIPEVAHRVVNGMRHARPAGLAASALMAFAIGAILYLGYIFLDAGTRGHFTWSLRFVSVLTFAALCMALSVLRHGL